MGGGETASGGVGLHVELARCGGTKAASRAATIGGVALSMTSKPPTGVLTRHSIRDPGVCLGITHHGKGGSITTVHIEGATGRPCGRTYVLRDSLAIVCSRGCAAQWCNCQKIVEASPAWRHRAPTHTHAEPQGRLAVSGVSDTQQLSNAFSLGQAPEALSRDG
jgi:hypothetical protein